MAGFPNGRPTFQEYRRYKLHDQYGGAVLSAAVVLPPFDTGHAVWAFDPNGVGAAQYLAGPTGTVTTPVRTAGIPAYYTFGSGDFIDFGDTLDTTWTTTGPGFTLYACIKPSTADLLLADAPIVSKRATGTAAEFYLSTNTNQIDFYAVYTGDFTSFTGNHSAAASLVAGTRYVVAVVYDPTLARTARATIYLNGAASTDGTFSQIGLDGVIPDTTAPLRIGLAGSGAVAPVSVLSYTYAYNAAHSAGTVASITTWLQTTKGWV